MTTLNASRRAFLRHASALSLAGTADNPDQRISEDTRSFLNQTYAFSLTLITQVSTLVSFCMIAPASMM